VLKFEPVCCSARRIIVRISIFNFVSIFSICEIRIRLWCFILCYIEFKATFFSNVDVKSDTSTPMHWNMSGCSHSHECNTKINSHVPSSTAFRMLHRVDRFQFFTLPSCEVPHSSRWYRFAFVSTCTRWTCTIPDVITHSGVAAITSLFYCKFHDFNMKYGVKQIRDLAKHSSCVGGSLPVGTSVKTSAFINP
jgi:hypothetical protein